MSQQSSPDRPVSTGQNFDLTGRLAEAVCVPAGEGEFISFGVPTRVKVASAWTRGTYSVVEQIIPAGTLSPPHVHENEDQCAYVLEGELGFWVGGKEFLVGPGGSILRPAGIVHAAWNPGTSPGRMLEISSPGMFDDYFRAMAGAQELVDPDAARAEIARNWGIAPHPELIDVLSRRHGVRF